ncbi:MFS-type transporter clz9-like [Harmonia axyridis]|uniref:MFS-type transporter clz9-like n=1 Tax=Harmonia axyridis TaxID=115357 RepID=UPI001E27818B|nr:MFS-type transporter clz9-like [Harmonia axyridis]
MPFQYKKKDLTRNRSNLNLSVIKNALDDIDKGKSIRGAALEYGIDRNTLRNYLRDRQKLTKINELGSQFKTSQIFSIEEEKKLVNYLLTCSKMNYGLTRKEAQKLACEYAKINSKRVPQSWTSNKSAGKDWFRGFMRRNSELSLRIPEATSLSRSTSFNKKNVADFFENLRNVREKYKFEAHNIYNCDETGCTTVQNCPKVLAGKHVRQVGQVTSAERGSLVTVCFAVNALGNSIPPFFIFPRVKYNDSFVAGAPTGSDGDSYPSGWMTIKSFVKYMKHFVKYSNASLQNRVLLILDNHESHVNIEVIEYAKLNGVTLLTLPPHCSNKLQPLDVAIYSSFKARYNAAMNNWMLSNPGRTITIYNIPGFVSTIMSQAFSQSNILSGFRKTGIHPYNPDIFTDEDFLCSSVTDKEMTGELQDQVALTADKLTNYL